MKINKNIFAEILGMLENNGCIHSFQFCENGNAIEVYSYDGDDTVYYFDNNNNLVDPQIFEIQKKIEKLEKEKKDLENKLKLLTNN